jgi:UDP-N-acetylmuramoylalanine--D-glutamate ligase
MDWKSAFTGKRITLMGLGVLGRGAGDAEFLAQLGARLLVTDKKTGEELADSIERLKKYQNIAFRLGGHEIEDFTDTDLVIKAAGVPLDSPYIAAARAAGVEVAMSTALFAQFATDIGVTIVGVTGTRGKTTVSHLIYRCLKNGEKTAFLGGNVRGTSTLAMLPFVEKGSIAVLELDSWQLQGFGDQKLSPHIAVFTNLMPDHQNYYPDMDAYFADKANIFSHQEEGDVLFVGESILEKVEAARPPVAPQVPPPLPADWQLTLVGEHNRENAAFAAAALRALKVPEEKIRSGIESFEAVEGRLQLLRELHGVRIYNDNNATTPQATVAALRALGEKVTIIIGGSEKNLPLQELVRELKARASHIVVLKHPNYKGSERLAAQLGMENVAYDTVGSLKEAVTMAHLEAKGGPILFSPAFASFGMFGNEYERNDEFIRLVNSL